MLCSALVSFGFAFSSLIVVDFITMVHQKWMLHCGATSVWMGWVEMAGCLGGDSIDKVLIKVKQVATL